MNKERDALQRALHALKLLPPLAWTPNTANRNYAAIAAIKEALAQPEQERCVGCEACIDTACGRDECPKGWPKAVQPEQEPVAWMHPDGRLWTFGRGFDKSTFTIPLYTSQPYVPTERQRQPLTDEQINEIADEFIVDYRIPAGSHYDFVRAIEAAHGIKGEA